MRKYKVMVTRTIEQVKTLHVYDEDAVFAEHQVRESANDMFGPPDGTIKSIEATADLGEEIRFPKSMHPGWHEILAPVFDKWSDKIAKLLSTPKVCPVPSKVFSAFEMDPGKVRIIMIGQDPYPSRNAANGIAFAAPSMTPSLKALCDDLDREYGYDPGYSAKGFDTTLQDWVNEGILLLNAALTVIEKRPKSMQAEWKEIMIDLLKLINDHDPNIQWVFMGKIARELGDEIKPAYRYDCIHPAALKHNPKLVINLPWKELADTTARVKGGTIPDWGVLPF